MVRQIANGIRFVEQPQTKQSLKKHQYAYNFTEELKIGNPPVLGLWVRHK